MTKILEKISLRPYNTFGIDVMAELFCPYSSQADIKFLLNQNILNSSTPHIILGGGSNQLYTSNFNGLIIHPVNDTICIINETREHIWLKADAGLDWDNFVAYTVNEGYGGIENLSNIPGNVGATPVQNIGAYGVEAKDCIDEVHLVSLIDGTEKSLTNSECEFGYRHSIFKTKLKNQYLVDSVTFKLSKKPKFTLHYGSVKDELDRIGETSLKTIRETIIKIRESKLPNHKEIGNGGSFFKNPVLSDKKAKEILDKNPNMPIYDVKNGFKKLAAGWLIEQCGLKGYTNAEGTAGIHEKQALVLINKGGANGQDIVEVARLVQKTVFEKFEINLEPEVIIH
ncbi:MAG: UDP-N-acetylmuramate dehydrogenase [Salinivirgaceae bacterium]|jgi:UDP-N-acetylmuramate dehydrogenase|nr:UDP-N-acetylmuramate dehydrogenase [Salinivirgaceae bacterium]